MTADAFFPSIKRQKGRVGRKPHAPTDETRKLVLALTGYGFRAEDVAKVAGGISEKTLRKHYGDELELGHHTANARVAEALFAKATGDGPQSVSAAIFWMKVRAGWKESPSAVELSGPGGRPIESSTASAREVLRDRVERIAARLNPGHDE